MDSRNTAPDRVPPGEPICPECGFDLQSGEACGVCGYDPRKKKAQLPRPHRGARIQFYYLIALLAVFSALFIEAGISRSTDNAESPVKAASETRVASQPDKALKDAVADASAKPVAEPRATPDAAVGRAAPAADPMIEAAAAAKNQPAQASLDPTAAPAPAAASTLPSLPADESSIFDITERNFHPPLTDRASYVSWMLSHTKQQEKYLGARWDRAEIIRSVDGIQNERVREAFLLTPREYFCRDPRRAYDNAAMPIGYGQTISGPHMVARMTDYLNPQPDHKVLEIGTGSGYQSAVLSELSLHVYTIEIVWKLAEETDAIYRTYQKDFPEYGNIRRKIDDGYYGWIEYAPFDRIIVTCGIDHIPPELLSQLAPDGIMVIPVGPPSGQTILRIVKRVSPDGAVTLEREDIYHGRRKEIFVPFTAKEGGVHSQGKTP